MFNAAFVKETIHQASGYGFSVSDASFDMGAFKAKRDAYVTRLNGIYKSNLANSEVTFIEGDARFVGPKAVTVGESTYTGKHVLIAVGGKPTLPKIPGAHLGITSDGFFDLEEVPKKVAVIGSGYIAVELAGIPAYPSLPQPTPAYPTLPPPYPHPTHQAFSTSWGRRSTSSSAVSGRCDLSSRTWSTCSSPRWKPRGSTSSVARRRR